MPGNIFRIPSNGSQIIVFGFIGCIVVCTSYSIWIVLAIKRNPYEWIVDRHSSKTKARIFRAFVLREIVIMIKREKKERKLTLSIKETFCLISLALHYYWIVYTFKHQRIIITLCSTFIRFGHIFRNSFWDPEICCSRWAVWEIFDPLSKNQTSIFEYFWLSFPNDLRFLKGRISPQAYHWPETDFGQSGDFFNLIFHLLLTQKHPQSLPQLSWAILHCSRHKKNDRLDCWKQRGSRRMIRFALKIRAGLDERIQPVV